ncbi:translation initiation factor eIF-2B subunit gamma-like isoform X1 [Dinothrombium tinctorium]|uniref:Translation initiation factor eIF2B subunit gamma n=1 Tax=Dinothrombium tinctorium TaxID=1965070 RepID=A0A443QLG9_9ACAR|nr:translation initiation factor eIF-2B subunit gamma-like isoform X1 [Dinothrombium tinctorium]
MVHELQAIIFAAGKGSRITELSCSMPKCLLPVGNEPIIFYPIRMLQKANFKEVTIIIPDIFEEMIERALFNKFQIDLKLVTVPFNKDMGTADSLRLIENKIHNDMLLISCDILTDFDLLHLINLYRIYNPTLTVVLSTNSMLNEGSVPGKKGKGKIERDLIGFEVKDKNKLLFLNSEADFEEEVPFHKSILRNCPQFEVHTDYLDTHIYVLKKWVLKFLVNQKNISSIKGELIPILIRKQFSKRLCNQKEMNSGFATSSIDVKPLVTDYFKNDEITIALQKLESSSKSEKACTSENKIECLAYLMKENFCIRTNHLLGYVEANRRLPSSSTGSEYSTPKSPASKVLDKVQIGNDCLIGNGTKIGERSAIKKSVIGSNCNLGEKVKIANSIIMDNVVIEEGCNIQGSIVCNGVYMNHNAEIKDCVIGAKQKIVALGKLKVNATLMKFEI